jgi:hypothetical protein
MHTTPASKPRIVKILRVVDTREYMETENDKWVAIPGSGTERNCDRCNACHEIHVFVALDDGTEACIGTTCADSADMDRAVRSAVNSAKRTQVLTRQLAAARATLAREIAIRAEVEPLTPPEAVEVDGWLTMGEARVKLQPWTDMDERSYTLRQDWIAQEMTARGSKSRYLDTARREVDGLERALAKVLAKAKG